MSPQQQERTPFPPLPPTEPVQEGARWRWHRPPSEDVATWFGQQPLDQHMRHEHYIGGVVLIPQSEKVKYTNPDGRGTTERFEQVFTPYVQIGTRIAYFRRLGELRNLIPVVAPAEVPRAKNPDSVYFNGNMEEGLWWHVVANGQGGYARFLCATWTVALYEKVSYAKHLNGETAMPMLQGRGTKQVGGGPDINQIAKAQTGAIGRALGVAGILVIGTGVACLPRRAEIMTRTGWQRYDEVSVGDDVLSYDAASDTTRWTPLRKINVFGEAPVVSLRSQSFKAICTADHKWAVRRKHVPRSGPVFELREAMDLARGGPSLVLAAPAEGGQHPLSERDAAILGWLATDGHVDYRVKAGSPRASITQNKPEHVVEIRRLLGPMATERTVDAGWQEIKGVACWVRQRHDFRLRASEFRGLMQRAGIGRIEELSLVASRIGQSARGAMLDAMKRADGHGRGGGWVFTKGKRWVLDLFQMLCVLEGRALGVEHPTASAATQIHVRSSRFVEAAKLSVLPEFPEPVWCPTTDYGTWVARLDGHVFITGNSAEDMQEFAGPPAQAVPGEPQLPSPPETASGESPVPRSDEEALDQLRSRATALQEQLQSVAPTKWREFAAWYRERAQESGWAVLDDAPLDALRGIVSRMERMLAEAQAVPNAETQVAPQGGASA